MYATEVLSSPGGSVSDPHYVQGNEGASHPGEVRGPLAPMPIRLRFDVLHIVVEAIQRLSADLNCKVLKGVYLKSHGGRIPKSPI